MGLQGVDEAKDNKFISELGMVNHALLERKTKASLTHEEYPGTPYTDFSEINHVHNSFCCSRITHYIISSIHSRIIQELFICLKSI